MLKWFRRKRDDKALAGNAEQELSTIKKMDMIEDAKKKLDDLCSEHLRFERRFHELPVDVDRRMA